MNKHRGNILNILYTTELRKQMFNRDMKVDEKRKDLMII